LSSALFLAGIYSHFLLLQDSWGYKDCEDKAYFKRRYLLLLILDDIDMLPDSKFELLAPLYFTNT